MSARRETASRPARQGRCERRIATLAGDGRSNRDIAQTLFVTTKTVETHLSRIYRKLDIAGRAELAGALTPA